MSWERTSLLLGAFVIATSGIYILDMNLSAAVLSVALGAFIIYTPRIAKRERWKGWIMGRVAMAQALGEALQRGLSPAEFIVAEMERDGATFSFQCKLCGAEDVNPQTHECEETQ